MEKTERELIPPEESANNPEVLLQQQVRMDAFLAQLVSKQQVLYSLIEEGKDLVKYTSSTERIEFQRKLDMLQVGTNR